MTRSYTAARADRRRSDHVPDRRTGAISASPWSTPDAELAARAGIRRGSLLRGAGLAPGSIAAAARAMIFLLAAIAGGVFCWGQNPISLTSSSLRGFRTPAPRRAPRACKGPTSETLQQSGRSGCAVVEGGEGSLERLLVTAAWPLSFAAARALRARWAAALHAISMLRDASQRELPMSA
jgi:hypothetical protein